MSLVTRRLANVQVEVFPQSVTVGVDVLAPTVQELVQIVEVLLAAAATSVAGGGGLCNGETRVPAIVLANTLQYVAVVGSQGIGKELGTGANIEIRIATVSTRRTTALVLGNLHKTLFSCATDGTRLTRTLLHGERGQENGGNTKLVTILVEERKIG